MIRPDRVMTPARAETIGAVSAELLQVLFDAEHAHPELDWLDLVTAAAASMRGIAAGAQRVDRKLTDTEVARLVMQQVMLVLTLPPEFIKILDEDGADGPLKAGFIPVRRQ